jgi:hypothetical protein
MKQANGKHGVSSTGDRLRHTPRAAEAELAHLEAIIRGVLRSNAPNQPIGPHYWRARFRQFASGYVLLPIQQKRVDALEKMIVEIERLAAGGALHTDGRIAV